MAVVEAMTSVVRAEQCLLIYFTVVDDDTGIGLDFLPMTCLSLARCSGCCQSSLRSLDMPRRVVATGGQAAEVDCFAIWNGK